MDQFAAAHGRNRLHGIPEVHKHVDARIVIPLGLLNGNHHPFKELVLMVSHLPALDHPGVPDIGGRFPRMTFIADRCDSEAVLSAWRA